MLALRGHKRKSMFVLLIFRAALLGAGSVTLAAGIALSYGGSHETLTYILWYLATALLLGAGLAVWAVIHRRKEGPAGGGHEELLRAARQTDTELDSCRRQLERASNQARLWPPGPGQGLPADRVRKFEEAPGAAKTVAYDLVMTAHIWINEINKEALERGGAEMSAVGRALPVGQKTLELDDGDRENLRSGLGKIESAQQALKDLIAELLRT